MIASVMSKNGWFKAYFQKRKAEGLPPQKALLATGHKLIPTFAHLVRNSPISVPQAIRTE
jgi:hypothetical protein